MSADNGLVITKDEENLFRVWEYCASMEYENYEEMHFHKECDSLEDALNYATNQYSEYGVDYHDRTKPKDYQI